MKTVKSLAVIGDMHVLDGGKKDSWDYGNEKHGCRKVPFIARIDDIAREYEAVAQVGDAWELWQGYMWQVRRHAPELVDRMKLVDRVYGNHDAKARFFGVPEVVEYDVGGHVGGVLHGHQFDPWNSGPGTIVGKAVAKLWGLAELAMPQRWSRWLENKASNEDKTPPSSPDYAGDLTRYEKGAVAMAKARKWEWVVIGHTHKAKRKNVGGVICLNAGNCLAPNFEFAWFSVDSDGALRYGVKEERL